MTLENVLRIADERRRTVLLYRSFTDMTLLQLSKMLNVTPSRVHQIEQAGRREVEKLNVAR